MFLGTKSSYLMKKKTNRVKSLVTMSFYIRQQKKTCKTMRIKKTRQITRDLERNHLFKKHNNYRLLIKLARQSWEHFQFLRD
jgi:hypothetical protein